MKKILFASLFLLMLSATTKAQRDFPDSTDMLVTDDLFVQSSIGVGFDMAPGYAFGYNTIVMKENNVRIFFEDTSVPPTFPSTDWLLEANSSSSGGGDYFRLYDVTANTFPLNIQATAPSNSLFVGNTGKVGIGTDAPALKLQLRYGDTPGIRLEQDGSMGYSSQSWDLSGNESNFFIRDVNTGALPFRIDPGSPGNLLSLKGNGNVGIGTYNPEHKLEVAGDAQVDSYFYFGDESTDGNWRVSVVAGNLTFEKRQAGAWVVKLQMQ